MKKSKRMTTDWFVVALISLYFFICLVSYADAAQIIFDELGPYHPNIPNSGNAIGILGLEVPDRGTFDVTFGHTFSDVWGHPSAPNPVPTFWGDTVGAEAAAGAILGVFTASGVVNDANDGIGPYWNYVRVPFGVYHYDLNGPQIGVMIVYFFSPFDSPVWEPHRHLYDTLPIETGYASFSPSGQPISEPSTLVLVGIGMFGVLGYGFSRKRRKKSSV